jgi:uncharacterized protein (TIGR02594 family)
MPLPLRAAVLPGDREPFWLVTARRYDGLAEVPGVESNPVILKMARAIGAPAWYHNDDQPWCAVFKNHNLLETELLMALGTRGDPYDRLRALTFLSWGVGLAGPALGATCVFSRPEGAHVADYLGEHGDRLYVYGGNQNNRVRGTWMPRERLRGYRWPLGVELPRIRPVLLAASGEPVSTNEA